MFQLQKETLVLIGILFALGILCYKGVSAQPTKFDSNFYLVGQKQLRYLINGNRDADYRIIFVHGTPGEAEGYAGYLSHPGLQQAAELISVDRLGFGLSHPKIETSLKSQAESIIPLLNTDKKVIVVGHSLGGSIAARLAMEQPVQLDSVVLISSSLDPSQEEPRWYNWVTDWPVINWFVPEKFLKANREIQGLASELELMLPLWENIQSRVHIIHGTQDKLAYFANAEFARNALKGKKVSLNALPEGGHFILWEEVGLIVADLTRLMGENRLE